MADPDQVNKDSRVQGEIREIDYQSTLRFFEQRAERATNPTDASVVLYQDKQPELAAARDAHERALILPQLRVKETTRCIDIGCGTARWATALLPAIAQYVGIDFSPGLVELGRERLAEQFPRADVHMQVLSVTDASSERLAVPGPYDLVILGGVLMYLNDTDVERAVGRIASLVGRESTIYIREPIALEERLTLDAHYSHDMAQEYSAVYRRLEDYEGLFKAHFEPLGLDLVMSSHLYPQHLQNRSDTTSNYWIFRAQ